MKKQLLKTSLGITIMVLAGSLYLAHKMELAKNDNPLYDELDSTID